MKNKNFITLFALFLIFLSACRDENLAPIATFDASEKGAYVRVVTQNNGNVDLTDLANSVMEYTVEFVDLEQGNLVSEYDLQITYEDNNPQNGDNTKGPVAFRTYEAAEFTTNKEGFKSLENIQITAQQALDAIGIGAEDILSGDKFKFIGSVTTTGGANFNAANSSASVNGTAFRGFFNFTLSAFCPSSLEGDYRYTTTAASIVCPQDGTTASNDLSGTVSVISAGNEVYSLSDWSFGSYAVCYKPTSKADFKTLQFTDTCSEVTFTGKIDELGEKWAFTSEVDGTNWVISWENTFGEKGTATVINPVGWNFVLAEE